MRGRSSLVPGARWCAPRPQGMGIAAWSRPCERVTPSPCGASYVAFKTQETSCYGATTACRAQTYDRTAADVGVCVTNGKRSKYGSRNRVDAAQHGRGARDLQRPAFKQLAPKRVQMRLCTAAGPRAGPGPSVAHAHVDHERCHLRWRRVRLVRQVRAIVTARSVVFKYRCPRGHAHRQRTAL
jgi:hypothetical protein